MLTCILAVAMIVFLAIVGPALALVVYSVAEMIYDGKEWKNTIGYYTYMKRFHKEK